MKRDFSCLIYTAAGTILRLNNLTDQQLLRDYAEHRSEEIDLVYSAALRTVCSACRAEDVTQSTFICRKHTLAYCLANRLQSHTRGTDSC